MRKTFATIVCGLALFAAGYAWSQATNWPAPPVPMSFPTAPAWVLNQAVHAVAITPTNGTKFAATKSIFVGGTPCNLNAFLASTGDTAQVYVGVSGFLPLVVNDVEATSTTCTGIIALY